jgi:DNA-binding transcriptional ArsR family regulator
VVQYSELDRTFAAVADPTRRLILERLGNGPQSISQLAGATRLSLGGVMKHVGILEEVHLVRTFKTGRVRECRLGPDGLGAAADWIDLHRRRWERRLDGLESAVARRQGREP